jgi:hypothetical protein
LATALAGGHEHHVSPLQDLLDLVAVLLRGATADLGVAARAEAAGELTPDVELHVRVAHEERLRVGVDRDELDPLQAGLDHPVHRVHAAAADADDLDDREVVLWYRHGGLLVWAAGLLVPGGAPPERPFGANPHPQVEGQSYVNLLRGHLTHEVG